MRLRVLRKRLDVTVLLRPGRVVVAGTPQYIFDIDVVRVFAMTGAAGMAWCSHEQGLNTMDVT